MAYFQRWCLAQVLITHSYHIHFDPKQLRKMQPYPPLATLYAGQALRNAGIDVAAFDSMLQDPEVHFATSVAQHRPQIVVLYEDDFNFLSKMCLTRMRQSAWLMAATARAAGAITIVHGSDSTDNPELFLRNGFDYVCCGEAEETLGHLCSTLLSSRDVSNCTLNEIAGLVRLDTQGRVVHNNERLATNPRWSQIRLAARDLIDLEPYRRAWVQAHGVFSTNLVSSRGCPYHCNWCAKPVSGNRFQLRPPGDVAEEMRELKFRFGAQHLWFGDDIFGLDHRWLEEFAHEVVEKDAVVPFKIQSRANLMTKRTVRNLKASGCAEVWMGVESGSQAVLRAMDKGLDVSAVRSARDLLRRAGIRACYFLQFGYPGEGWAELQQTITLVRETRPDDIGVSFSYPLPGTVFYERVKTQLGYKRNWSDSDDLCIMYHGKYSTGFYRAVRDALHVEVDSWKGGGSLDDPAVSALWTRIAELEPVSQNAESVLGDTETTTPSTQFVSIEQLNPARSA